jgi:hypothetical protein
MSNDPLYDVLKLPKFAHFKEISKDDWRDPALENPSFSISSKGWIDHRTNGSGSLLSLFEKPIDIEKIYKESRLGPEDLEIIKEYFGKHRSISLDDERIQSVGIRVNRHKGQMSLVTPMYSTDDKLQCLHQIKLDQRFGKAGASRLLGKSETDRGILLKNGGNRLIQLEGLEDGLIIWQKKKDIDVLITGPAVNFKRGLEFHAGYEQVTLLLDNDQDEASLRHSRHLGSTVERLMPTTIGFDANEAVFQGCFDSWWKSLKVIPWSVIELKINEWDEKQFESVIEELNRRNAVICIGNKVAIMREGFDPILGRDEMVLWTKGDLFDWYADRFVYLNGADGKTLKKNSAKHWFENPKRRKYEGFTMEQDLNGTPSKYYNLWRGFGFESKQGNCSLFYEHMYNNIACEDRVIYEYLLDWMADAIQNPIKQLPETAIVLQGDPGTGKTFFLNHFGKLFGPHYLYLTNAKYLTGGFNGHLKDTIFLFADEAFLPDKEHYRILKGIVTQEMTMIEFKHKDAFPFKNHIHLAIASNDKFILPVDIEDRRFFMLNIGNKRKKDIEYFAKIKKQLTGGGYSALLWDLMNRDISSKNLLDFPGTQTTLDNKLHCLNSVGQWVFKTLCDGELPDSVSPIGDLYHKYWSFCQGIKTTILTKPMWKRELMTYFPTIVRRKITNSSQSRYVYWSDSNPDCLEACRKLFSDKLNSEINWEFYE